MSYRLESNKPRLRLQACAVAAALAMLGAARVHAEESAEITAPPAPAPATTSAPEVSADNSVFFDPAGFLLFGPTLGAELGLGHYSLAAYGRWLSGGLLAKSLFESDSDKFTLSYGAGARGRYYFRGGLVGPHLGISVEAIKTRTENRSVKVATNNVIFVPEIEGGWRFGFGHFFVGVALGVGYVVQMSKGVVNIDGGTRAQDYVAKDYSNIYGSASVDLGLLF